ncbi:hypothetical protein [Streptococcus pantholopis]|uniref:Uncharacterized protein n=1 Tax=Streptococcus pantholopis TaxID=1811193 RepID=A0A172Q7N8_9STRE|nr:hypothetical protein [Streptococcus pantholopis]AND79484.1 hypothetical protein A0O21_05300 [Streptococcus pantholopis]
MITEKNYNDIANDVYAVDSGKTKNPYQKGDKVANNQFQVITDPVDNLDNGMQAMAVAPIVDGEPDTSQIVIAYARVYFLSATRLCYTIR